MFKRVKNDKQRASSEPNLKKGGTTDRKKDSTIINTTSSTIDAYENERIRLSTFLEGGKSPLTVSAIPRRGQKIPAFLVDIEDSIFKLIICIGSEELTIRMSLLGCYTPRASSESVAESKVSGFVLSHITCLLQMIQIVDIMLLSGGDGMYSGELYLGNKSLGDILIKNGLAKSIEEPWTIEEFQSILSKVILDI